MAKKLTALLLIVLMLAGTISCAADETEAPAITTAANDTAAIETEPEGEPRIYPDIPTEGIDYGDSDFKFIHFYVKGWEYRRNKDIYAEAENGSEINDAVYRRNFKIQETYGVKITLTEEPFGELIALIKNINRSGDHVYDVVYEHMPSAASAVTDGQFIDLNTLGYVDFTKPWWDQTAVRELTVGGKLFQVATDLNIIDKDATAAVVFNKAQAEARKLDDLYKVVQDGKWTLDYLMSTFKGVSEDVDGDLDMDEEDFWAFLGKSDVMVSFFVGGNGSFIKKDSDGTPYYALPEERNISVASKLFELVLDKDNYYNQHTSPLANDDITYEALFPNGHGLFYWIRLECVTQMRASDTDFGILPTPKYDEAQEKHYSYISPHISGLLTVPITAGSSQENLDRIGLILEALSAESKYTLMPAYYETALKTKGARDDESEAMLDMIFENRVFDLGITFGLGNISENFRVLANADKSDIASFAKKYEKATSKAIERFIEKIEKIDG